MSTKTVMSADKNALDGIAVFMAVVKTLSFTRAADTLGVSTSAVSQTVRSFEMKIGGALFQRSTRALALTPTGVDFLRRAEPAYAELTGALELAMGCAERPSGLLRLTMSRAAFDAVVAPTLTAFQCDHPEVNVEIQIDGRPANIVENGFDAGLHYGESPNKELTSVEVYPESRSILTAAPSYLALRESPSLPEELLQHAAVVCRSRGTGLVEPWKLVREGVGCIIEPRARLIASDLATLLELTLLGHGISRAPMQCVAPMITAGRLMHLLEGWSIPLAPIRIHFSSRRTKSAALSAFIDHLLSSSEALPRALEAAMPPPETAAHHV